MINSLKRLGEIVLLMTLLLIAIVCLTPAMTPAMTTVSVPAPDLLQMDAAEILGDWEYTASNGVKRWRAFRKVELQKFRAYTTLQRQESVDRIQRREFNLLRRAANLDLRACLLEAKFEAQKSADWSPGDLECFMPYWMES